MKKNPTLVVTLLLTLGIHSILIAQNQDQSKPNIVIILSDDMGWAYPGFTGGLVEMPHLNELAKTSLQLTQFYVQPVCTPTRSSLLTGRYPFRTGTEDRFHGNDDSGMLKDEKTIAQGLKEAGYFTAIFGKWHLGEWQTAHLPLSRGFDHQYGFYGAMIDYYRKVRMTSGKDYEKEVPFGRYTYDWHRNGKPLVQDGYSTYLIADEVESVLEQRDSSKPFFFYVAFNAPHGPSGPGQIPPECRKKYPFARYTQTFCMDQSIGRIISSLKKRQLFDNTILIFLNDNGGIVKNGRDKENGLWRGGKGDFYEGGVRVPFLVSWPAKIQQARKEDAMHHVVDLYPTLISLAGGTLQQPLPLDGKDMSALWLGHNDFPREEILFSPHVIRRGEWKLIEKEQPSYAEAGASKGGKRKEDELFNLKDDPYEKNNLAASNPEKVKELKEALKTHSREVREQESKDKIPGYPPTTYGEKEAPDFKGVVFQKKDGVYTVHERK